MIKFQIKAFVWFHMTCFVKMDLLCWRWFSFCKDQGLESRIVFDVNKRKRWGQVHFYNSSHHKQSRWEERLAKNLPCFYATFVTYYRTTFVVECICSQVLLGIYKRWHLETLAIVSFLMIPFQGYHHFPICILSFGVGMLCNIVQIK